MKLLKLLTVIGASVLTLSACIEDKTITEALSQPEAVLYKHDTNQILVANINGDPSAKDDNGFISIYGANGDLVQKAFIDGKSKDFTLNGPKGMAISGDVLWVADIDAVRKFDPATGAYLGSIKIKNATFVNDIAADGTGGVVVTDSGFKPDFSNSGTDAIYHITANNKIRTLAKGSSLKNPNGITAMGDGTFAFVNFNKDGMLKVINLDGKITRSEKIPHGQLDGIELTKTGKFVITSWTLKGAFMLEKSGKMTTIIEGIKSPADLAYNLRHNAIYIPSIMQSTVNIVRLK